MAAPAPPAGRPDRARTRRISRRARRLRLTVVALVVTTLVGAAGATYLYLATRPEPYRPGEEETAITRGLTRGLPADAPTPRFTDVTDEAGLGDFVQFAGDRTSQLPEDMGSGAAWGDYDNDGDEDLLLVSSGGSLDLPPEQRAPSLLYENLGNGRFQPVNAFPETRIIGMAATWGDYDGDGWLDLIVTGYGSLILYRNESGSFARDGRLPELDGYWAGAAWGDYDRDGDLDLYVCGYVRYVEDNADRARATLQYGRSVPYTLNPASYPAQRNLLFRNESDGSFSEVASALGVENSKGRSLGALWHDFDDDGWLDLYVANDISDNVLFRNSGGTFEEISHAAWVADYRGAMGLAAGDWNRDGDDDLFITHWVAQENALYDSLVEDKARAPANGAPAVAPGSALRFMDVADQQGLGQIALRQVGWGAEFDDLDGDGWLDLVVSNGSTFETEEAPRWLRPQLPFVFWNDGGQGFHNLAPLSEPLATPRVGRGLALADYDDDGDQDLLFVHHAEGVQLLRNEMQTGNWLKVNLRPGTDGAPGFSEGARLVAVVGDAVLRRSVGRASYLSQSSRVVHFGLGEAARVDRLEVRWPDAETQLFENLEAGQTWELTQGDPEPRSLGPPAPQQDAEPLAGGEQLEREQIVAFWTKQRAAMDAMKIEGDVGGAIELFREALRIKPDHEDSRYYLANCLASRGDVAGAIAQLEKLERINPRSHRTLRQLGILRTMTATSPAELEPARELLERSLEINREETGSLLALGEVEVLRGDVAAAERYLSWACRTNPRAAGGFWLRAYLAWRQGDASRSIDLLKQARVALGEDWVPEGFTAEGDVQQKQHREETPLSRFWQQWDGLADPETAFSALQQHLDGWAQS
jgi:tetratricopeptide (TPR) repeat protein